MRFYHGTAKRFEQSIRKHGLRQGSYVSTRRELAQNYARAYFEDEPIVVLTIVIPTAELKRYLRDPEDEIGNEATDFLRSVPPKYILPAPFKKVYSRK